MNIFAYDPCPVQSALWLDDIRKNKMIVEGCQLLSTTVCVLCPALSKHVYKVSHLNHPCAIWARSSLDNFKWLLSHTQALHEQRCRPHKSAELFPFFNLFCDMGCRSFPQKNITPFVNCARNKELGLDFTDIPDTRLAYKLYTSARWQSDNIPLTWAHGEKPLWVNIRRTP